MATITNYATLTQAIIDEAEDDGVEFAAFIPVAIDNAEEILFKELDLPDLEIPATGSLTINSNTLNKPNGYKLGNYLKITTSTGSKLLKKRRDDYIQDYWPNPILTGEPKYYADLSSSQFVIAPTPDSGYPYVLKYPGVPTKLSNSNQTNYFVNNCHPILFAASMIEMSRFMKAWNQVQVWQSYFNELRDAWNIEAMRNRRDDGSSPQSPDGPNTLKHTIKGNA